MPRRGREGGLGSRGETASRFTVASLVESTRRLWGHKGESLARVPGDAAELDRQPVWPRGNNSMTLSGGGGGRLAEPARRRQAPEQTLRHEVPCPLSCPLVKACHPHSRQASKGYSLSEEGFGEGPKPGSGREPCVYQGGLSEHKANDCGWQQAAAVGYACPEPLLLWAMPAPSSCCSGLCKKKVRLRAIHPNH